MAKRLALGDYDQLHHFIAAGVWDAAPVEAELLVQADRLVGGSDAVLVIDDTAIPKKGTHSVGVAAQYASALGKTANCQTLVSLTLARGEVPVMLALRLFLPEGWTSKQARLERAGVPTEYRTARTKPEMALAEIDRVIAAGVRFGCVLADAGYGLSAPFRQGLTARKLAWAVGIPRHLKVYPADVSRHPHGVERHGRECITRTVPVAVVRDALAGRVELDPGPDACARAALAVQVGRHLLTIHQIDDERRQAVASIGETKAGEGLTTFDHGAQCQRLQAIEVGEANAISPVGPASPQRMQRVAHRSIRVHRARLDAGENPNELRSPSEFSGIQDPQTRSRALFTEAAKVIMNPRCMNCHPATDRPLQGNDRHIHVPPVTRGDNGGGVPGNTCGACHMERNFTLMEKASSYQSIPGHPRWGLAPIEMAWEEKSMGEICAQLKDPGRNGGRDLALLHEHLAKDNLIAWAWNPGVGRAPVPGTQERLGELIKAWIDTGAQCP